MAQTSLAAYVAALDEAGLLARYTDEKRVDELPELMEKNPDKAVYVERVKDCGHVRVPACHRGRSHLRATAATWQPLRPCT